MRADRLVAILLLLQTRGQVTAREVAGELEVSEKTARRDLEALAVAGLPVYPQVGRGGGWRLLGGGRTDLSGLNADEARRLFLAVGAASIGADTSSALRKLVRALPESFRDEAEAAVSAIVVDAPGWGAGAPPPPSDPPEHLEALQRAVVARRRIVLGYVDRQRAATERWVDPLGLVSKGVVWYLVGGTEKGLRTFRVSRVSSVMLTDVPAERPPDFDLAAAWRSVVDAVGARWLQVRATVRVAPRWVGALRGQFGADLVLGELDGAVSRPGDDGRVAVMVGGPTPRVIAEHLAGWGSLAEVVDPPEVRDELARIGAELVARYGHG